MKKKITLGIGLAVMSLVLLTVSACGIGNQADVQQQMVQVTRGNITVSVSGSGQIEAYREARLTFGSGGKVAGVLVKEGDRVKEGDVLAQLDTRPLELAMAQARGSLTQAELAVTQAELAQYTAEYNLQQTRDTADALDLALFNAEISRDQAERALGVGIAAVDFKAAEADLRRARAWYKYLTEEWSKESVGTIDDYDLALQRAREQLDTAQARYDNIIGGYDDEDIAIKRQQLEAADRAVEQARQDVDGLADDILLRERQLASATQATAQARAAAALAQRAVDDAQRQLDEATIYATFDSLVARVYSEEGDLVPQPTLAPQTVVRLIDPARLELLVEVDEIDIPLVSLEQKAVISVDALPDDSLTGTVTSVYPVPNEEGGVVLYDVRLALDVPAGVPVRVGMSATAEITIAAHRDVLLVPSRALGKDSQGRTTVMVVTGEGQVEERPVTVGLDDGLRAEIMAGLAEGETVSIESRAGSSSSSPSFF